MHAYLDNNILIDIEQNNISKETIINNIDVNINRFFYSSAHLQEAHEIKGSTEEIKERLKKRFNTITETTDNNYLFHELKTKIVHKQIQIPSVVYQTITEVKFGQSTMKGMVNNVSEEQKALFRSQLNLDITKLNNYNPVEVVEQINEKKDVFGGFSLLDLIDHAIAQFPNNEDFGLHNKFAGVFELLDLVGYWKDKYNEKSNYARLWDSNHAYYASSCDYFVSDDRRTRNKANVAFHLFNINTKVVSSRGEK
ncbi:hypothetical protein ASG38_05585 [Flavobacterium sp. Leaf359]|uniref:hypothetical protein n=1 Tax=Flavobacterium sp. Leaf359 TaxID=1736351 RepID=UPI0006FD86DF|nr:hypothetical protein [Flavobacterium sp. Leaf359]KQS48611.1 hypothetical protein ASG38_05585 [Flavobacterium sp. Leaf359]